MGAGRPAWLPGAVGFPAGDTFQQTLARVLGIFLSVNSLVHLSNYGTVPSRPEGGCPGLSEPQVWAGSGGSLARMQQLLLSVTENRVPTPRGQMSYIGHNCACFSPPPQEEGDLQVPFSSFPSPCQSHWSLNHTLISAVIRLTSALRLV